MWYRLVIRVFFLLQVVYLIGWDRYFAKVDSYWLDIAKHFYITATNINHQYSFFTNPIEDSDYAFNYLNLRLYYLKGDDLVEEQLSNEGSLKHLVNFPNRCRIVHAVPIVMSDSLLFEGLARSYALHFINDQKQNAVLEFEAINAYCTVTNDDGYFTFLKKNDTIYKQTFYFEN